MELNPEIAHNTCYLPLREYIDAFFLDNRTTSGGISLHVENMPIKLIVEGGTFVENSARPDLDVGLIRHSERYGHGGAMNIRLFNSSGSTVCLRGLAFTGNFAEAHAGALALSVAGNSSNNNLLISRSLFRNNWCTIEKCTGGAVGIYFFSGTQLNTFLFMNCTFTDNLASSGGAMVLSTSVSAIQKEGRSDILRLTNCSFLNNAAFFEGTALGVFSLTHTNQFGIPVEMHDW